MPPRPLQPRSIRTPSARAAGTARRRTSRRAIGPKPGCDDRTCTRRRRSTSGEADRCHGPSVDVTATPAAGGAHTVQMGDLRSGPWPHPRCDISDPVDVFPQHVNGAQTEDRPRIIGGGMPTASSCSITGEGGGRFHGGGGPLGLIRSGTGCSGACPRSDRRWHVPARRRPMSIRDGRRSRGHRGSERERRGRPGGLPQPRAASNRAPNRVVPMPNPCRSGRTCRALSVADELDSAVTRPKPRISVLDSATSRCRVPGEAIRARHVAWEWSSLMPSVAPGGRMER